MKLKLILSCSAAVFAASLVQGTVLFSENFDGLTAGNLAGQSNWSGDGGSRADYVVATNTGGGAGFGTQSLFFQATGTNNTGQQRFSNDLSSLTGGVLPTGQDIYVGYAYRKIGDYSVMQVSDLLGATNDAGNYKWDTNENEFNNIPQSGGLSPSTSAINYVAVRFVWDGVTSTWNNPSMWSSIDGTVPDLDMAATSTNPTTTGGYASWTDLYFNFGAAASLEAGDGYQIDNIGITTTAADMELVLAGVPEPSTYAAIAGAAVLGLAVMRRRRSK